MHRSTLTSVGLWAKSTNGAPCLMPPVLFFLPLAPCSSTRGPAFCPGWPASLMPSTHQHLLLAYPLDLGVWVPVVPSTVGWWDPGKRPLQALEAFQGCLKKVFWGLGYPSVYWLGNGFQVRNALGPQTPFLMVGEQMEEAQSGAFQSAWPRSGALVIQLYEWYCMCVFLLLRP